MTGSGERALDVLQRVFGYQEFRGQQQTIIEHVCDGGDAVVLMPTGSGKSLCYQIPALVRDGTGVVISPLIALMQDQVDALTVLGVRAGFLNSTQDPDQRKAVEYQFLDGTLDLLYLAPERLCTDATQRLLDKGRLALFAIDEAHCVSQWGHDFRKEYLGLSVLHERWPQVPRIAVTATATRQTHDEISRRLGMGNAQHFVASFDRPNIQYRIVPKASPQKQLLQLLDTEHDGDSGIVYCLSRNSVEKTAQFLVDEGHAALPYHAGLDNRTRADHQARFLRADGLVMVATIAFGMGIDKPDVRFVGHLDLPRSVEGYYQETGRAGRDGLPSTAWLAYGLQDVVQQRRMIDESDGDLAHRRRMSAQLDAMLALCETADCRRGRLLRYFGEEPGEKCQNCDTCMQPPETFDGTEAAQKLLSAIVRVARQGGPPAFGAGQYIDILLGKKTGKITSYRHDELSVFGIGAGMSEAEWRGVVRQLLASGLLTVKGEHGTLALTDASSEVLSGARTVTIRKTTAPARTGASKRAVAKNDVRYEINSEIFEKLRAWRAAAAKEQGVPAYVIFHDATLRQIAAEQPGDMAALAGVSGVGETKLARYGQQILDVLRDLADGIQPSRAHHRPGREQPLHRHQRPRRADHDGQRGRAGVQPGGTAARRDRRLHRRRRGHGHLAARRTGQVHGRRRGGEGQRQRHQLPHRHHGDVPAPVPGRRGRGQGPRRPARHRAAVARPAVHGRHHRAARHRYHAADRVNDPAALALLRRARDRIDRDYGGQIGIATLARETGYSTDHFIRAFRAVYGETPGQYRSRRRVERACDLLRSANLTVTEICFLVGFASLGSFSARFTEITGVSPTGYRQAAAARGGPAPIPGCFALMWRTGLAEAVDSGEAAGATAPLPSGT